MRLSDTTVDFLRKVIRVAKIMKIEGVILDHECVRGTFAEEGVMIIHRENIPNFEFPVLGIGRIDVLNSRLSLLDKVVIDTEEMDATTVVDNNGQRSIEKIVKKLMISNGSRTKVEFSCTHPAKMAKPPKALKDPVFFNFQLETDAIDMMNRAQGAMRCEAMSFCGSPTGVVFKLNDVEGDMFEHDVANKVIYSSEAGGVTDFVQSYKHKILMPLLREANKDGTVDISLTSRGFLSMYISGIKTYIAPELA